MILYKIYKTRPPQHPPSFNIHKPQGFNLGAGPLIGLAFQWLLRAANVDARLATGLLIVSCLVRMRLYKCACISKHPPI